MNFESKCTSCGPRHDAELTLHEIVHTQSHQKVLRHDTEKLPGGIIADEMGLGKTLTVLASISASREGAYSYMRFYKPIKAVSFSSRATLVVVSSTCK